jgi:hypothetical protein
MKITWIKIKPDFTPPAHIYSTPQHRDKEDVDLLIRKSIKALLFFFQPA